LLSPLIDKFGFVVILFLEPYFFFGLHVVFLHVTCSIVRCGVAHRGPPQHLGPNLFVKIFFLINFAIQNSISTPEQRTELAYAAMHII